MREACINFIAGRLLNGLVTGLSLILGGCASISPPSATQDEVKELAYQAGPGPYSFECDAPAGRYDESNVSTSGDTLLATGTLRFLEFRSHPDWAASASITFAGANRIGRSMGVQAIIMPDAPNYIQFAITGQGGAQERFIFANTPVTAELIPFEVKLSKGNLEVSIAGQAARIAVGAAEPARLSLFCSTAIVHYSNVIVE